MDQWIGTRDGGSAKEGLSPGVESTRAFMWVVAGDNVRKRDEDKGSTAFRDEIEHSNLAMACPCVGTVAVL